MSRVDVSELLAQVKVELNRLGEKLSGDRVQQWCDRAGYLSWQHLDEKGLNALLNILKSMN